MNRKIDECELKRIIDNYFNRNYNAKVFYQIDQQVLDSVINNCKVFEKPDVYSIYEEIVIGIEHFEFDCYKNSRKMGSEFKKINDDIKKDFDEVKKNELKQKKKVVKYYKIEEPTSLEYYYSNFEKAFIKHYKKIEEYTEHLHVELNCPRDKIKFIFFAEDVSPLGSLFQSTKNGKITPLLPIYSKSIRELLKNSSLVEFLVVGFVNNSNHEFVIIENRKDILDKFEEENADIIEGDLIHFKPEVIAFAEKIERK